MYLPDEIKIALDGRNAEYKHEPFNIDLPPGDPAFTVSIGPKRDNAVWQIYVMTFGNLKPVGPTQDVWVRHRQIGVMKHNDPLDHSILDFPYPMWAPSTKKNPHYLEVHNLTGEVQNLDLQVYMAYFPHRKKYARWMSQLILLGYRLDVGRDFLNTIGLGRSEFEEIYKKTRRELLEKRKIPLRGSPPKPEEVI